MQTNKLEIEKTHPVYDAHIEDWEFYELAYEGGRNFIGKVLFRNERESHINYAQRLKEAVYLNFPREIVDLYNFYLTEKEAVRQFGDLAKEKQWDMFFKSTDGMGMDYKLFFNECQKLASIYGILGILVDKPLTDAKTVGEEIRRGIYPYCSVYTPINIMDWKYEINPQSGRMQLSYLKLREGEDAYYVWTTTKWEHWVVEVNERGIRSAKVVSTSEHSLGCIPLVFMVNLFSTGSRHFGLSDLADISPIAGSIVRDMSCGDEVIKGAGFPMFRIPAQESRDFEGEGGDGAGATNVIRLGVKAVHEFNPEWGEGGKPDWIPSEVLDPIEAILKWVDRKSDEIYRLCHLSGVHGQRKSNNEVSSGLALRYEFQQLSSVLNKKAINMNEAEYGVIQMWLLWQNKADWMDKIEIRRARNFSIDELAMNLENTLRAISSVQSSKFKKLAQTKIVKQELPDISDEDLKIVVAEIEAAPDRETGPDGQPTDAQTPEEKPDPVKKSIVQKGSEQK